MFVGVSSSVLNVVKNEKIKGRLDFIIQRWEYDVLKTSYQELQRFGFPLLNYMTSLQTNSTSTSRPHQFLHIKLI